MVMLMVGSLYLFLTVIILFIFYTVRKSKGQPKERMEEYFTSNIPTQVKETEEKHTRVRKIFHKLGSKGVLKRTASRSELRLLQADIKVSPEEFSVIQMILYLIALILGFIFTGNFIVALIFLPIMFIIIRLYIGIKISAKQKAFNNQLGDALGILANSLRSGYSYLQAMNTVAREMPEPISAEFAKVVKEMSLGMSDEKSLENLTLRVSSDDLKLMVTAILIQKETGGNLAEILDNISDTIKDRIKLKGEVKTLTAQGRMSAIIIVALPFALGGFMMVSNPSYIMPFIDSLIGKITLGYGFLSILLGIFIINRIIKIEV